MKRAGIIDPAARDQRSASHLASWYTPGLSDALGDRLLMFDNTAAASLELLRFKREFSDWPAFETALRARMDELAEFDHPAIAKVRALRWLGEGDGLALVSNHTAGQRLSEVLLSARGPLLALDLIRQLAPVLAELQQQGDNVSHGILTPERIVVTPGGRLVVVEHVLGAALQSMNLPADRLRSEFGLAVRGQAAALDSRDDVVQLGLAALSLVLGRRVDPSEYPLNVAGLLDELQLVDAPGSADFSRLQGWMQHALQLGGRTFGSAVDAHNALREVLGERDSAVRVISFPGKEEREADTNHGEEHEDGRHEAVGHEGDEGIGHEEPEGDVDALDGFAHEGDIAPAPVIARDEIRVRSGAPVTDAGFDAEIRPTPVMREVRLTLDAPRVSVVQIVWRMLAGAFSGVRAVFTRTRTGDEDAGVPVADAAIPGHSPWADTPPTAASVEWPPASQAVPRGSSILTRVLVTVCVLQTIVIAGLLVTRPPEPATVAPGSSETAPAPTGAVVPSQTRARGGAATKSVPGARPPASPATPPAGGNGALVDVAAQAPKAAGRGLAAAWQATADFVGRVFTRIRDNLSR